jgi:hypothetical protein
MTDTLKIGNAQGFWGDDIDAPARLIAQQPDLDYLTLDYLAEVTLSIMALQKSRNPEAGYARDFVHVVQQIAPHWKNGSKVRIVANAGGLNPRACAEACVAALREADCSGKKIALVTGDDVLETMKRLAAQGEPFTNLDTGRPIADLIDELVTANAYFGAAPLVDALAEDADIVLTGRVADPCMVLAPCMGHFGWKPSDYDRIAGGLIAGHVLECGAQATGGISTEWLSLPDPVNMGFPYVEMSEDGSFIVTKPANTGGAVNARIVKEQLLYEMHDPGNYLSPDAAVDLLGVTVEEVGENRVRVSGFKGNPPPKDYKISATYREGYRASGQLTIFGRDAVKKAKQSGEMILERLKRAGYTYARSNIECLGANACAPGVLPEPELLETVLRISVADEYKHAVERFAKEIAPLACGGAQGTTGYAGGRPSATPVFGFWPCLLPAEHVKPVVEFLES